VTPTIFGSTVGYPSDSSASCCLSIAIHCMGQNIKSRAACVCVCFGLCVCAFVTGVNSRSTSGITPTQYRYCVNYPLAGVDTLVLGIFWH